VSRSGRTRLTFIQRASVPPSLVAPASTRPNTTAAASSSESINGGRRARTGSTAADARLSVDRDAELVQGDHVAADRPLAHTEVARRRRPVDDDPLLEQLEEGEESGGGT
jgi:hypothetical protein